MNAPTPSAVHSLRRELAINAEPISGSEPIIDFISSDQTLDRYREIIVPSGWRLDNYRKNPVVQNAHQYGDILFTIGKALVTEIRNGGLYQRVQFATEVNPLARIAYGLYRGKFLNAVSVGFLPIRWEYGDEKSGFHRKFLEHELLEVSAVGIPANPNALQLGLKSGAVARPDLQALAEILHSSLSLNRSNRREEVADFSHSHLNRDIRDTLSAIRSLLRPFSIQPKHSTK